MFFWNGSACAAGILRRGQEKDEGRSGATDELFNAPVAQKTAALRVAVRRAPAVSPGATDGPASLFAWLLADRHAGRQRRLFPGKKNMLKAGLIAMRARGGKRPAALSTLLS